jgi:hypothetical protein
MAETPFLNFFGGEFDPESGRFRDKQGRFVPAPPQTSEPSPTDAEAEMKNKQAAEDVQDIKQNTEDAAQALFDFAKERERDKQKEKREKQKAKRGGVGPSAAGADEKDKNFLQLFAGEFVGDITGVLRGIVSSIPVADQALRAFDKLKKQNDARKAKKEKGGVEGGVEDAPLEEAGVLSDGELDETADAEPKPVEGNLVEVILELRNANSLLMSVAGNIIEIDRKFAELLAHLTDKPLEDVETEREERRQGKIPKQETPELEELFDDDKEGGLFGDLLSGGVAGIVGRFLPAVISMLGGPLLLTVGGVIAALLATAVVGLALRALIDAETERKARVDEEEREGARTERKPVTNKEGENMFIITTRDGEELVVPESQLTGDRFTQEELETARPVTQEVDPISKRPISGPSTIEEGPMPPALAETSPEEAGSDTEFGGILANLARQERVILDDVISQIRGKKGLNKQLRRNLSDYYNLLEKQSPEFKKAHPDLYEPNKNAFYKAGEGAYMKGSRALLFHKPKDGKDRYQSEGHGVHRAILDGKGHTINEHSASVYLGRKLIIPNNENPTETELAPTPRDQNIERVPPETLSGNAAATPVLPSPDGGFVEPNPNDTVSADAIRAGAEMEFASASVSPTTGVGGVLMNQVDASESTTNQTYVDASGTETHTQHASYRDAAGGNRGNMYT